MPWTWWAPRQGRSMEGVLQGFTERTRNPADQPPGLPSPVQPVLAAAGSPGPGTPLWDTDLPLVLEPGPLALLCPSQPQPWRVCRFSLAVLGSQARWPVVPKMEADGGLAREELAQVQGLHELQPKSCPWSWPVTCSLLFILSSPAGSPRASAEELSLVLAGDLLPPLHLEPHSVLLAAVREPPGTPRVPRGRPCQQQPSLLTCAARQWLDFLLRVGHGCGGLFWRQMGSHTWSWPTGSAWTPGHLREQGRALPPVFRGGFERSRSPSGPPHSRRGSERPPSISPQPHPPSSPCSGLFRSQLCPCLTSLQLWHVTPVVEA